MMDVGNAGDAMVVFVVAVLALVWYLFLVVGFDNAVAVALNGVTAVDGGGGVIVVAAGVVRVVVGVAVAVAMVVAAVRADARQC